MPLSRGSAVAQRRSHKAGLTWSGMLVSFDRVQWLDASRRGIPLDCLDPTLDIPSEFSRRASIFDYSLGIPDSGARDRLSNPFGGCACDLSRLSWVRSLAYKGRKRPWRFAFLPVGRAFSGGSRCDTVPVHNSERPSVRRKKTVRRCIYGGSYLIYRICPLVGCCL